MRLRLLLPRGGGRAELRRVRLSAGRDLDWDGCVNARDLGGLPTVDGGVTRTGALVRSETVDRLSPDGWRALREYGVRTIIDLREEDELSTRAAPPRALVMELAAGLELDRRALRRRPVVE